MKNAEVDSADYIVTVLLQSKNYRDFLTEAYAHLKTAKKSFSLSLLAKKNWLQIEKLSTRSDDWSKIFIV